MPRCRPKADLNPQGLDMDIYNLVSFAGIFVLIGFAWILSADKKNMNWRVIGWGIGLQILIALFIFVVPAGSKLFLVVNDIVVSILESENDNNLQLIIVAHTWLFWLSPSRTTA